jgi:hypothetical protein
MVLVCVECETTLNPQIILPHSEYKVYLPREHTHCGVARDGSSTFWLEPTWWVCHPSHARLADICLDTFCGSIQLCRAIWSRYRQM